MNQLSIVLVNATPHHVLLDASMPVELPSVSTTLGECQVLDEHQRAVSRRTLANGTEVLELAPCGLRFAALIEARGLGVCAPATPAADLVSELATLAGWLDASRGVLQVVVVSELSQRALRAVRQSEAGCLECYFWRPVLAAEAVRLPPTADRWATALAALDGADVMAVCGPLRSAA